MSFQNKTVCFVFALCVAFTLAACQQPSSGTGSGTTTGKTTGTPATSSGSTTTTSTTLTGVNAIQIITKADPTGSFDAAAVPAAGGASVKAQRLFNLDGSLITTGNIPTWYVESRAFLTSTRTAGTPNPASPSGSDTPCAYFDSSTDNNPETTGFYTVDGYNVSTSVTSDVDQCAGVAAAEANSIGLYVKFDRRFMNSTDKMQIIVKAKPLETPTTAPTPSSCVVGGIFDASACVNQLFTVTMRSAPGAAAKPFYFLFPSAKSLDLLAESVLLPIQIDTSITTVTIDRVKGGAIIYGFTIIRLQ